MATEKCVVLSRRPAGCTSGSLYVSELRLASDGESAELHDIFDDRLPDDAQQVALCDGYQVIRTLGNRLLYRRGQPLASSFASPSEQQLDDNCIHLLQVGSRVVVTLKVGDTFRMYTFNPNIVNFGLNGLEALAVSMTRFCALSGRVVQSEAGRRMRLALAGRDINVSGVEEFPGWGILLVDIDENNILDNVCFRSMFVSYQTRLCLRERELLVWREGDLTSMLALETTFNVKDDRAVLKVDEQISCGSTPRGDRSSNFVAEINGQVVAVFRQLTRNRVGVSQTGFVCCRLDERRRWIELCHKRNAFLYSVCVTNT